MLASNKGIAMRFPRFIRIREDKKPEDCTTAAQIRDMFESQAVIAAGGNSAKGLAGGDDDDGYM